MSADEDSDRPVNHYCRHLGLNSVLDVPHGSDAPSVPSYHLRSNAPLALKDSARDANKVITRGLRLHRMDVAYGRDRINTQRESFTLEENEAFYDRNGEMSDQREREARMRLERDKREQKETRLQVRKRAWEAASEEPKPKAPKAPKAEAWWVKM